MLSSENYIRMSLEYDLFWVRIMKEHTIFIEGALPSSQALLADQADQLKQQFDRLLAETIRISDGVVSKSALQAEQYYTRFTEAAEQAVQQFTGIDINRNLTKMEYNIVPYNSSVVMNMQKEQEVAILNQNILNQTSALARFKAELLNNQASCRLFTFLYTADLDHILHEALKFIEILDALQNRDDRVKQNYREFWNHNMADHAKSMRGLFDPTETKYFSKADQFAKLYDALISNAVRPVGALPGDDLIDAQNISEFKAETTKGLIECKVKAIMSVLYTDHLFRETNHYIYLLQS
jgi:hypothetical protein